MSEFEKLYGEVLLTPEESAEVTIEEVVAALTEVALEVKEGEEVFIQDPAGNIFRKQQDGKFHLNPKRDYVIMRRTCSAMPRKGKSPTLSLAPLWTCLWQLSRCSSGLLLRSLH